MDELVELSKGEGKDSFSKEKIDNAYKMIIEFYDKLNFLSEGIYCHHL